MGSQINDKINKDGNSMSKFIFQIRFNLIVSTACILDLIFNDNNCVTLFEYLLFSLTIFGTVIRFRAYKDLGHLFTFDIGTREDHKLIKTGIYEHIRHPGYVGGLLILIPTWLFTNVNTLITLVLITHTIYMYWNRIKCEEIMLIEHFGDQYVKYASEVKRLIPYVF